MTKTTASQKYSLFPPGWQLGQIAKSDGTTKKVSDGVTESYYLPVHLMEHPPDEAVEKEKKKMRKLKKQKSAQPELARIMSEANNDNPSSPSSRFAPWKNKVWVPRSVSLFWSEKLWILYDQLQIYAVILSISSAWPWPPAWTEWTRWVLFVNGDVVGYLSSFSTYDADEHDYDPYWITFLILPTVLILTSFTILKRVEIRNIRRRTRTRIANVFLFLGAILYLDIGIAVLRIGGCTDAGFMVAVPREKCLHSHHLMLLVCALVVALVTLLGLPVYYVHKISPWLLYTDSERHDEFVKAKEMEYILGLSMSWREEHFNLWTSFKRHFAYLKVHRLFQKLALACVLVFLHEHPKVQAASVAVTLAIPMLWYSFVPPYRCKSSSAILFLLGWANVVNSFFGYLKAAQVQNVLLVDSKLTVMLSVGNGSALGLALLVCLFALYRRLHWPVDEAYVVTQTSDYTHLITSIREGRSFLDQAVLLQEEFLPLNTIKGLIEKVNEAYIDARDIGHALESNLYEVLNQLVSLHNIAKDKSFLPHDPLERVLGDLRERVDQRDFDMIMVRPVKKRMLLKLVAIRAFIGGRKFHKTKVWLDDDKNRVRQRAGLSVGGSLDTEELLKHLMTKKDLGFGVG